MFTIIAMILVIIGSINWFAVGVFDFNIVNWIFTAEAYLGARIVYGLVGLAGLWLLIYLIVNKFSPSKINAPDSMKKNCCKKDSNNYDVVIDNAHNDDIRN